MTASGKAIPIYLEKGPKRTFAGAIDWPGWCRSARDEAGAVEALLAYAPRYARVLRGARLGFEPPTAVGRFIVTERLAGSVTTDFGTPGGHPSSDASPLNAQGLRRAETILKACWRAFDRAVLSAGSKSLRKGPRGGGRDLKKIVEHAREAEVAYLSALGWKPDPALGRSVLDRTRREVLMALAYAATHAMPEKGPRGGARWKPRYFVRRAAWHILDHAWEIEDRSA
jgi:hypothetical protein